jgi:UrcA family protein
MVMRVLAACAIGFALAATAARAQDNGPPPAPGYGNSEEVIVAAPHYYRERSPIGAPIENVSLSQPVSAYDVDLRTRWGAREFRDRIRVTARTLCHRLDAFYVGYEDTAEQCYRRAVADAMPQADHAISNARGGYYGGYDDDGR